MTPPLIDFLRCYVRVQRCEIENYGITYSEAISATFQKCSEEDQEESKQIEQNAVTVNPVQEPNADESEERWYGETRGFDDFNMLENYIYTD
ncbi:unnamed protein product [Adineta ricciae]|uniref:Uncharacterized protein n=1 Tax=Adineta ricciae TaxID=249248 RepID=A0A816HTR2_ADIRI|nr:unnamed protein product [Adineta ricciae]